jgi:hypothetical protein
MKINLYREDGYSLWVLLKRFPQLLLAVNDSTPPDDPRNVVFYRPSFGRADSKTAVRKQFGEFDLLIGTPNAVYAIESKPDKCGELDRRTQVMTLRDEQVRRHDIFRTYRTLWQKHRPSNWNQFRSAALAEFASAHPGWTMAESRDLLGQNLEFVLQSLQDCGDHIQDTVLHFCRTGNDPLFTSGQGFACVKMPLDMVAGCHFVSVESSDVTGSGTN